MEKMKNKWGETGVNVCDRTVRNRLNETRFVLIISKPELTRQQKKMRLKFAKKKHSWCVDNWMKVIFSEE